MRARALSDTDTRLLMFFRDAERLFQARTALLLIGVDSEMIENRHAVNRCSQSSQRDRDFSQSGTTDAQTLSVLIFHDR